MPRPVCTSGYTLLEQLNLETERVATHEVAITDIQRAPHLINEMAATIEKIGLSPFKF